MAVVNGERAADAGRGGPDMGTTASGTYQQGGSAQLQPEPEVDVLDVAEIAFVQPPASSQSRRRYIAAAAQAAKTGRSTRASGTSSSRWP